MRGFFMPMSKYSYFVIGRSKVEILQKFDNSVLVRYVKTGVEACVNPNLIKSKEVGNYEKKGKYPQKKSTKNKPNNNQLNFEL